jgi:1-phosphofructokinase
MMADQKSPVVTLTPSPTLDRTYFVKNLVEGGVNRAYEVGEELAGKGINVARGLQLAKIPAPGVVPIGNADPAVLKRTGSSSFLLPLWVDGTLRVSTTVVEYDGPTTKINEHPRPCTKKIGMQSSASPKRLLWTLRPSGWLWPGLTPRSSRPTR